MKIISYLQSKLGFSRRHITWLIDQGLIFLNWININSYNQELCDYDKLEIVDDKWHKEEFSVKISEQTHELEIVIFNKPVWYVVSKSDSNNQTIYDILPVEFRNYYYIWRLDKDSHWLLLLTNNPKLVNEYEHPKNQIEKEYIVQINVILKKDDIEKCLGGVDDDGEILKIKKIQKLENKSYGYKIILTEGKKRHIRRVFKSLGYRVLDLQRVREWEYQIWDLKPWEWKRIGC